MSGEDALVASKKKKRSRSPSSIGDVSEQVGFVSWICDLSLGLPLHGFVLSAE